MRHLVSVVNINKNWPDYSIDCPLHKALFQLERDQQWAPAEGWGEKKKNRSMSSAKWASSGKKTVKYKTYSARRCRCVFCFSSLHGSWKSQSVICTLMTVKEELLLKKKKEKKSQHAAMTVPTNAHQPLLHTVEDSALPKDKNSKQ